MTNFRSRWKTIKRNLLKDWDDVKISKVLIAFSWIKSSAKLAEQICLSKKLIQYFQIVLKLVCCNKNILIFFWKKPPKWLILIGLIYRFLLKMRTQKVFSSQRCPTQTKKIFARSYNQGYHAKEGIHFQTYINNYPRRWRKSSQWHVIPIT